MSFLYLFEIYWALIHDLDFSVLLKKYSVYINEKSIYSQDSVQTSIHRKLTRSFQTLWGGGYGKTESHCVAQDTLTLSA